MSSRNQIIYVDATNQIMGRLASKVAKFLLDGSKVYIFNAEKAVISGDKSRVIERFRKKLARRTIKNPEKITHKNPKSPDQILRRAIRGMLPYKKPKGREAYKKLKVYIGKIDIPKSTQVLSFEEADATKLGHAYIYLGDICKILGWES
jgi:large subunit ribosomal protein L13